jgi:hypothetical protein
MKFTAAWANLAKENRILKISALTTSLGCVGLAIALVTLIMKPPLVIERECSAVVAKLVPSDQHSDVEIRTFLALALSERFDTEDVREFTLLSEPERLRRQKEQEELKLRGLIQKVVPRLGAVQIATGKDSNGLSFIVNADRILAVGTIRSAFLFPLKVQLISVDRTSSNPAGLLIQSVQSDEQTASPQTNRGGTHS